ncbi:MAG: ribosomal protein L7/L12 [Candidatus Hydrogenedentota bacterium]
MDESTKAELAKLIVTGKKIPAIKLYREETSLGLKEAKEAAEALEKEMREAAPDRFLERYAGCGGVLLFGLIGLSGTGFVLF